MAYKVKYGDSWASLETQYPGIKQANPSIRVPKAGIVLNTGGLFSGYSAPKNAPTPGIGNPYQYTPTSSYVPTPVKQTVSPTTVPTTYPTVKQTQSPTTVPTTNKVVQQTVSPTVVPTKPPTTGYGVADVRALDMAMQAAEDALTDTGGGRKVRKARGGEVVYKNAKGKVIHNWKAMYGIQSPIGVAQPVFEGIDAGAYDMPVSGSYSWRI